MWIRVIQLIRQYLDFQQPFDKVLHVSQGAEEMVPFMKQPGRSCTWMQAKQRQECARLKRQVATECKCSLQSVKVTCTVAATLSLLCALVLVICSDFFALPTPSNGSASSQTCITALEQRLTRSKQMVILLYGRVEAEFRLLVTRTRSLQDDKTREVAPYNFWPQMEPTLAQY